MLTAIKAFFAGTSGVRNLILAVLAGLIILAVFGSVAYASYSFAQRNKQKELDELKTAMHEQFDKERQNLIETYQRSDKIAAELSALRGAITKQGGEIAVSLSTLRKQYKEIYEVLIPEEGVQQWEAARQLYNSAARPAPPQSPSRSPAARPKR